MAIELVAILFTAFYENPNRKVEERMTKSSMADTSAGMNVDWDSEF